MSGHIMMWFIHIVLKIDVIPECVELCVSAPSLCMDCSMAAMQEAFPLFPNTPNTHKTDKSTKMDLSIANVCVTWWTHMDGGNDA